MSDSQTEEVLSVVAGVHAALADHEPDLQGFVLAEALATFIARHVIPDDVAETRAMQAAILREHIAMVRKMIPVRVADVQANAARGRPN